MNKLTTMIGSCLMIFIMSGVVFSQSAGDFQSHQSGLWDDLNTWERYNGSSWVWPSPVVPDTAGFTTIRTGDSVSVVATGRAYVGDGTIAAGGKVVVVAAGDSAVQFRIANGTLTVNGLLKQTGICAPPSGPYSVTVEGTGDLVIGNGGTFQQDQYGAASGTNNIPVATWDDGSTLLVTGLTTSTTAGSNPGLSFYNIVWDCPNQTATANFGFNPPTKRDTTTTIRGDFTVLNTGAARVQLTAPQSGNADTHTVSRINILGNVNVLNGSVLTSQGTSNAYTDIIVTVHGNTTVQDSIFVGSAWRWSQLSISRGSQSALGTTTWFFKGDVYYGPKTTNQNSTDPNTGTSSNGKFVFNKAGTQTVTLDSAIAWSGKCNMQFGDGVTATVVDIGNSPFGGSACQQIIKDNTTVIIGPDGYIGGGTNTNSIPSNFATENGATLVIASQNGIRATGSSGAVRVSGTRDFGTAANFEYNGTQNQRLGSGFPASANNLTIDGAGAWVDSVAAFTINGTLAVTDGDLDLNGCTITLGPTGLLSEAPGSTVKGTSGVITATRTLTAPGSATDIAGLGVAIGSSADLGSTVLARGHAVQNLGVPGIKRYFDITPTTNTGLDATLVFKYDESELDGILEPSLGLFKSTDAGTTWSQEGGTLNQAGNSITLTGLNTLSRWSAGQTYSGSVGVPYAGGWNLISNPVTATNDSVRILYPDASFSYAFRFDAGAGYTQSYTMENGRGYWEKFPSAGTQSVAGAALSSYNIPVVAGWNLIGSISFPVDTGDVESNPGDIRSSAFFGYPYTPLPSHIVPGKGYWVKTSAAGEFVLSTASPAKAGSRAANPLEQFNTVTFTDARGIAQTLYLGADDAGTVPVEMYEMPPLGPEGTADVRFASGRMVEVYRTGEAARFKVRLTSMVAPVTVAWNVNGVLTLQDATTSSKNLTGTGSLTLSGGAAQNIVIGTAGQTVPSVFSLGQNYPNPFNPSTEIAFTVEATGPATLEVYNVLGQRVASLFNGIAEAGKMHNVRWSADQTAAGVYYYRLQSNGKMETRSMMLLK